MDLQLNNEHEVVPEAYEKLLLDALLGDATNFAHWEEVAYAWKFVDSIREAWDAGNGALAEYECGSMGPKESKDLLAHDGNYWVFTGK